MLTPVASSSRTLPSSSFVRFVRSAISRNMSGLSPKSRGRRISVNTDSVTSFALADLSISLIRQPLLRTRCERPCRRSAEQRDEVAALQLRAHSITSSARASRFGGTSRPELHNIAAQIGYLLINSGRAWHSGTREINPIVGETPRLPSRNPAPCLHARSPRKPLSAISGLAARPNHRSIWVGSTAISSNSLRVGTPFDMAAVCA